MSRKPAFGLLVAAVSIVVLALSWAMVLLPLAVFPLFFGDGPQGPYVTIIRPGFTSAAGGIVLGDLVDFSTLTYAERLRLNMGAPAGRTITLRVRHAGVWSDRVITSSLFSLSLGNARWLSFLISLTIGVFVAAIVVVRRPSIATAAFAGYVLGAVPSLRFVALFAWLPDPIYDVVATVLETAIGNFPIFLLLTFVTRFPVEPTTANGRLRMRVADITVLVGAVVCLGFAIFEPVRLQSWRDALNLIDLGVAVLGGVLAALQYRESSGEDRRRIGWVLVGYSISLASFFGTEYLVSMSGFNASTSQVVTVLCGLALPLALAYAILRHRVLDVGFALNRTVVYAVVTTVVVVAVSLVDWLAGKLIGEKKLALALEALVTIALGVALNAMHARIERVVERAFFRSRHRAELQLRNGIQALAFAAGETAIECALTDEVAAALHVRSTAYFRLDEGTDRFRCIRATGWHDVDRTIDRDSLLVRTLHVRERPVHLADFGITETAVQTGPATPMFAVPIADRHELRGFVLYGSLLDGTAPDPELVDLLGQLGTAAATALAYVEARAARKRLADIERLLPIPQ